MEKTKILVIDDEKDICDATCSFLTRRNYEVFTATSPALGLQLARIERPALVLLDMRMGDESGLDILPKIKEIDKSIKVILVTAVDDEESIRKAKSLGADDYVVKPFTSDYLSNVILQKMSALAVTEKKMNK